MKCGHLIDPEALSEKIFIPSAHLPMHYSNSEILEHHHAAVTHDYSSLRGFGPVEGIAVAVYIFLIIKIFHVRLTGAREYVWLSNLGDIE
ncbi:hypothetical protein CEXT_748671 [Caerostris extrusa]|uniref:Uncharacterized protein n=1 Tax=Caerostris extrusa TaxID=172846 RepID=A0AAV4QWM8_CAEEX|nr:hypothetical protein CEXT_748671 [Caerostris extrusa]